MFLFFYFDLNDEKPVTHVPRRLFRPSSDRSFFFFRMFRPLVGSLSSPFVALVGHQRIQRFLARFCRFVTRSDYFVNLGLATSDAGLDSDRTCFFLIHPVPGGNGFLPTFPLIVSAFIFFSCNPPFVMSDSGHIQTRCPPNVGPLSYCRSREDFGFPLSPLLRRIMVV